MHKKNSTSWKVLTAFLVVLGIAVAGVLVYGLFSLMNFTKATQAENITTTESTSRAEVLQTTAADDTQQETVSEDYLKDIVFLGDSRIVGMADYGLIPKENTFAEVGINHIDFMRKEFTDSTTGITGTFDEILKARNPKKVYIALGVNGIGFIESDEFLTTFQELIEKTKASAPDATIIVQSILPVENKEFSNKNLNNANIKSMNEKMAKLAQDESVHFIDPSVMIEAEGGGLDENYNSGDGLHFNEAGYQQVCRFILNNPVQ